MNLKQLADMITSLLQKIENIDKISDYNEYQDIQDLIGPLHAIVHSNAIHEAIAKWLEHGLNNFEEKYVRCIENDPGQYKKLSCTDRYKERIPDENWPVDLFFDLRCGIEYTKPMYLGEFFKAVRERLCYLLRRIQTVSNESLWNTIAEEIEKRGQKI